MYSYICPYVINLLLYMPSVLHKVKFTKNTRVRPALGRSGLAAGTSAMEGRWPGIPGIIYLSGVPIGSRDPVRIRYLIIVLLQMSGVWYKVKSL